MEYFRVTIDQIETKEEAEAIAKRCIQNELHLKYSNISRVYVDKVDDNGIHGVSIIRD